VRVLTVVGSEANEDTAPGLPVEVDLSEFVGQGAARVIDLWTGEELGEHKGSFAP
jgi:hypothetical protein